MKSPQKTFRRRNYLINPHFQLRFMLYVAAAVLAGLLVLYFSNSWYFDKLLSEGNDLGLDPSHPYFEFIEQQRALLLQTYLAVSAVVFLLLMVAGLFLSHRIAGPIYRIENYLKEVIAGRVDGNPVRLRKGDFFPEIANIVNDAIAHLVVPDTNRDHGNDGGND